MKHTYIDDLCLQKAMQVYVHNRQRCIVFSQAFTNYVLMYYLLCLQCVCILSMSNLGYILQPRTSLGHTGPSDYSI